MYLFLSLCVKTNYCVSPPLGGKRFGICRGGEGIKIVFLGRGCFSVAVGGRVFFFSIFLILFVGGIGWEMGGFYKAGERYQPLPGRVRALSARRAVSRDQTAAPIRRHSPAARPRVLRDKLRCRCWLELPLGSDCWSIAAGAKPAHEQAKGQHEAHTHSGPFSEYRLPCYGCWPPPYVLESGPVPSLTPSHEDGSDGGVSLSSLLTLPAAAGAGRLLYLIQRLFLFVCRNGARQMKFTVQAQRLQYRQILFTFLFHIRTSLSIATVRLPALGSRSLRAAICLRQLCRVFHLLGNRAGPVGIIRRRTQLIIGCLFFR